MRTIAALAVLAVALTAPAAAQDAAPILDRVAAVVIGFAAEETATVGRGETTYVQQQAPGSFFGTTEETGTRYTFVVTEPSPCVFEGRFEMDGELFAIRFNADRIANISFEEGEAVTGYSRWRVVLDGPDGVVELFRPDGTSQPIAGSSPIGTSLTRDELEAAAAAILAYCAAA